MGRRPQAVEVQTQIAWRGGHEHLELGVETQHGKEALRVCSKRVARGIALRGQTQPGRRSQFNHQLHGVAPAFGPRTKAGKSVLPRRRRQRQKVV